jgi:hypothetical protein
LRQKNCRPIAPLHRCTVAPLHRCTVAPLHRCTVAPLHRCTVAPLRKFYPKFSCVFRHDWNGTDLKSQALSLQGSGIVCRANGTPSIARLGRT